MSVRATDHASGEASGAAPDAGRLLGLVLTLSRRLRLQAAVAGACLGGALALGALEVAAALAWSTGRAGVALALGHAGSLAGALLAGAVVGGGVWWRARRSASSPAAAARLLDRSIADAEATPHGPRNGDRIRVALDLVGGGPHSRFAAAAVGDAWRTARATSPARLVPWRRPRAGAALALLLALAIPLHIFSRGRADGTRPGARIPAAGNARTRAQVESARQEVRALAELARQLRDPELGDLAQRLTVALDALGRTAFAGARDTEIAALVAETRAATDEARLASVRALAQGSAGPGARPAAGAAEFPAGGPGAGAGGSGSPEEERRRRLGGLDDPAAADRRAPPETAGTGGSPPAEEPDRQLKRLGRGLEQPPPAGGGDWPGAGQPAGPAGPSGPAGPAGSASRERLARAEERMRRALGSGGGGSGDRGAAERGRGASGASAPSGAEATAAALAEFERRARGQAAGRPGRDGEGASAGGEGRGDGAGGDGTDGTGRGDRPGARQGEGDGDDSGEGVEGPQLEATLAEGPGPSRAQSIAVGADLGFSDRGYDRTYRAYQAAVAETLDLAAVPEGRQRLVRRYFELIRPRTR